MLTKANSIVISKDEVTGALHGATEPLPEVVRGSRTYIYQAKAAVKKIRSIPINLQQFAGPSGMQLMGKSPFQVYGGNMLSNKAVKMLEVNNDHFGGKVIVYCILCTLNLVATTVRTTLKCPLSPAATPFPLAAGNFRPQERRACLANCTPGDHKCKINCDLHEQAGLEDSPRPCSQLAYEAFHYRAIERARAARAKREQGKHRGAYDEMLKAYVTEGFGLHFATDLFAPGHQRTPAFEMREGVGRDKNKVQLTMVQPYSRMHYIDD